MKYFVILVIGLIGVGVFLRLKNDVSLSESAINVETETKTSHLNIYKKKSYHSNQQQPQANQGQSESTNSSTENSSNYSYDSSNHEELLESCPYIDSEGNCSSEPLVTEVPEETFVDDTSLDMEAARNAEDLRRAEENEYNSLLNEQTFESLRSPASDE